MKKILVLTLVVLVLVGIAYAMVSRGDRREWTTDSQEARAELERGLEALRKFYHKESSKHFKAALEHDPDFAVPKVLLLYTVWEREDREQLLAELREVDLARLTERERVLVGFTLAKADRDTEKADLLIQKYLEAEPGDPYALMTCSTEAWEKRDWERAERHYRKLLEKDPNWVNAQNRLGYIAMAQGKFKEAEEAFLKYHYVAPDQANPHDSMGELLTLLGRYAEARAAFEKALEIDPGFCVSYYHLADMFIMSGDFEPIGTVIARAAQHCSADRVELIECRAGFWRDFHTGDYQAPFTEEREACRNLVRKESPYIFHLVAISGGRFEEAIQVEDGLRAHLEEFESDAFEPNVDGTKGLLLHMEGARLAAQGKLEEAQAKLLQADDHLLYWGNSQGILKLYNLLNLAALMRRTGDQRASDAIYQKVHSVNAHFAEMVTGEAAEVERAAP